MKRINSLFTTGLLLFGVGIVTTTYVMLYGISNHIVNPVTGFTALLELIIGCCCLTWHVRDHRKTKVELAAWKAVSTQQQNDVEAVLAQLKNNQNGRVSF